MYPSSMASHAFIVAVLVLTSGAVSAQAQQEQAPPPAVETVVYDPGAGAPAPVVAAEPYQLEMPTDDGPRFRFGFSLGAGFETVDEFSAWLFGFDFRLGVQINDMIGLYVQPHLSIGQGTEGSVSGSTGTFAATAMIDFTIVDRFFAGAGFGYGVANNPSGPALALRAGAYPISERLTPRRRKGLMVGIDLRAIFTGVGTVVQFMGSVGYEAF